MLDEKDGIILDLLQKDCRLSLTKISQAVDLSIDATKKRIQRMIKEDIFFPKIQMRPRNFGFKNVVDVKIKFKNYDKTRRESFVNYLKNDPYVVEMFSVSGRWDFSIVFMAKDSIHQGLIVKEIRSQFGDLIEEWVESITTHVFKFEQYDMRQIIDSN